MIKLFKKWLKKYEKWVFSFPEFDGDNREEVIRTMSKFGFGDYINTRTREGKTI